MHAVRLSKQAAIRNALKSHETHPRARFAARNDVTDRVVSVKPVANGGHAFDERVTGVRHENWTAIVTRRTTQI